MMTLKTARKLAGAALVAALVLSPLAAEDDDWDMGFDSGWDDGSALFGGDDDFFGGDGIVDLTDDTLSATEVTTIFEAGSIKVGGNWSMGASTATGFGKDIALQDALYDTTLSVNADAQLYIDARPTDRLRMYMKGGINYPYVSATDAQQTVLSNDLQTALLAASVLSAIGGGTNPNASYSITTYNGFYVKELFTDFDVNDRISARFGKQTITWGVGYFFSPASNIVNLSTIDPEDPTAQVDGPLALKLTGTLPRQNIFYLYAIPETSMKANYNGLSATLKGSSTSSLRDTALAAKTELVFGSVELGLGGWYKYEQDPIAMATLTGPCTDNGSFFAEGFAQFDDDIILKGTIGGMFMFNEPGITLMAQYYYDGEETSAALKQLATATPAVKLAFRNGSNLAGTIAFSKLGINNVSANVFGLYNVPNETLVTNANVSYGGVKNMSFSAGPSVIWNGFDNDPTVSVKLSATLGGGKF
ncbi:MAG: hypothetical protein MJ178_06995 [Treponemataceae bacterium]|nr:hypothetical protein [Treponemataceae bacterium]